MLEIIMIIAMAVLFARMASMDDHSPLIWGVITAVACMASLAIPLPLLRVVIAGVVVFVMMIGWRVVSDR